MSWWRRNRIRSHQSDLMYRESNPGHGITAPRSNQQTNDSVLRGCISTLRARAVLYCMRSTVSTISFSHETSSLGRVWARFGLASLAD